MARSHSLTYDIALIFTYVCTTSYYLDIKLHPTTPMIKPRAVRKLPECSRCRFYCGNRYLFCAVMPDGVDNDFCPYFAPDPDVEIEELWEPEGARYVGDELVIERATYNGEEIKPPP